MQFRDNHTANETGERVELVKPGAPEGRHLRLRDGDTAKQGEDDDDERVQEHADEGAWREGGDRLAERDREEFGDEDHEELISGSAGGRLEAGNVIQREEEAHGTQDTVG